MGKKGILFLVWFLGFVSAVEGAATWYNAYTGGMWNNPGSALIDTMLYNRMMAETSLKPVFRTSAKEHLDFPANNGRLQGKAAFPAPWQPNIVANNASEDSNQPTR